jgi:chaperonin GroEL
VCGGGVAYIRASKVLDDPENALKELKKKHEKEVEEKKKTGAPSEECRMPYPDEFYTLRGDEIFGVQIVKKALEEPAKWIAQNAGYDGSIVVEKIKQGEGNFGFNALTEKFEDLVEAGVIDPKKVVRVALQNAADVASLLLTTEVMIAEKPKKEEKFPHTPPDYEM